MTAYLHSEGRLPLAVLKVSFAEEIISDLPHNEEEDLHPDHMIISYCISI